MPNNHKQSKLFYLNTFVYKLSHLFFSSIEKVTGTLKLYRPQKVQLKGSKYIATN